MRAARKQTWAFILLLAAGTLLAYQPIWRAGFIWDDNLLLLDNPLFKQGDGWWRIWCGKAIDYVPAVSSTWWLEWRLWQNDPPAFHLVNLAWHILDSILLWRVLRRLQAPGAWLAAALFALHPVNVETAAWVAEQKNTEAMFFFLGALWCHLQFEDGQKTRWFWMAVLMFALALACKTAVAPLPFIFLGIAWGRRERIKRVDVFRILPFFLLSCVAAVVALWIQKSGVEEATTSHFNFWERLARAGQAVWFYLGRDVLPMNLVSIYPKWPLNAASPLAYLPGLLLVGLLAACFRFRKTWGRPLLFGFGYFLLMLLPVLGFFDISFMRYSWVADHWQYFAIIGPLALLAAAIERVARRHAAGGIALAGVLLTACGLLTWRQARIYKSGDAFWAEFLRVNRPAIAAYDAGQNLLTQGRTNDAVVLFRKAIELQPAFSLPYNSIGELLRQKGQLDEALPLIQTAVELRRDFPEAQKNLGLILLAKGRTAEALEHWQRNADLLPRDAAAQHDFGKTLLQVGLPADAVTYFQKTLALRPSDVEAWNDLGSAFQEMGRLPEAATNYQKALSLRPDFIPACNNLGWLLATAADPKLRDGAKALELAQRASALSQNKNPLILETLAAAYAENREFANAVKTLDFARSLPQCPPDLIPFLTRQSDLYRQRRRLYQK